MALHEKLKELDDIIVNTVAANSLRSGSVRSSTLRFSSRHSTSLWFAPVRSSTHRLSSSRFSPSLMAHLYPSLTLCRSSCPLDSIEKGQKAMAIVDLNQIWFIDNKFGVTIRLQQALFEQSAKLPSFAFQGVNLPDETFRLMLKMRMRSRKLMISKNYQF